VILHVDPPRTRRPLLGAAVEHHAEPSLRTKVGRDAVRARGSALFVLGVRRRRQAYHLQRRRARNPNARARRRTIADSALA
jgi:hypothetical protein